jgi:hypothetical protein
MRWLLIALLSTLFAVGCDLNPQPEVPGADEPGEPEGAAGAAGAPGGGEVPIVAQDDPALAEDSGPADYNGGLQSGKASRPDGGRELGDFDGGAEAAPPPIVAM